MVIVDSVVSLGAPLRGANVDLGGRTWGLGILTSSDGEAARHSRMHV